jgi:hypothetical protein
MVEFKTSKHDERREVSFLLNGNGLIYRETLVLRICNKAHAVVPPQQQCSVVSRLRQEWVLETIERQLGSRGHEYSPMNRYVVRSPRGLLAGFNVGTSE